MHSYCYPNFTVLSANSSTGILFFFCSNENDTILFVIVTMVGEYEVSSADPNCPVLAHLNLAFPEASWVFAQNAASITMVFLLNINSTSCTTFLAWSQMQPALPCIQTSHHEIANLDKQLKVLETELEVYKSSILVCMLRLYG